MGVRHYFLILIISFAGMDTLAQDPFYTVGSPTQRTRQRYKIKKNRKMATICPAMKWSRYPYHSIGFKLGDPFAITYKASLNRNLAVVVDGGRSVQALYRKYYQSQFSDNSDTLIYSNHKVNSNFVLQARVLYQTPISKAISGLDWYLGLGWQWQFTTNEYEYVYEPAPNSPQVGFLTESYRPLGPEATVGVEYSYSNIPVAAFFELQYFQDISLQPSLRRIMGGAGLRFIF